MNRPGEAHMPPMDFFLIDLMFPGNSILCLSVIISLRPIFKKNRQGFGLSMQSLKSPIIIIISPSLFHFSISSFTSWRKTCMGHIILLTDLSVDNTLSLVMILVQMVQVFRM